MSSYMADLGLLVSSQNKTNEAINSPSRKNNTTLDMQDFLMLMVAQFQNQSIDNTADTSEMMNQMVQMQSITAMTNMTDATIMSYAGSLVGKEVTIGQLDAQGKLQETVVTITGTGLSNGEQVVFAGDTTYRLSEIMAVGRLPALPDEEETPGVDGDKPTDGTEKPGETTKPDETEKPTEPSEPAGPDNPEKPEGGDATTTPPTDNPAETPETPENGDQPEEKPEIPGASETQKV